LRPGIGCALCWPGVYCQEVSMPLLKFRWFFLFLVIALTGSAVAQTARVTVYVSPPEAYVFADNQAIGSGHKTLELAPGRHTIAVYNYGFQSMVHEVDLVAGQNPDMNFALQRSGEPVSGPFGVIQIEGAPHAAVLLNGKAPEYFVAHGDEVNNHIWWKQQLLVQPGIHEVTLIDGKNVLWSGKVKVEPNTRSVVHAVYSDEPKVVVKTWTEGEKIQSAPRFTSGIASTTIAVAPVVAKVGVAPKQINCSEPAKLAWSSTDALHASLKNGPEGAQPVGLAGERTVSPPQTTTYELSASGQGGTVDKSDTLNVTTAVQSTLTSTPEAHYLRVGDTVLRQDETTLTWSTSNADKVVLEPVGKVDASGSQTMKLSPEKEVSGTVNETKSYKLVASNVCGGSETKEATVHLTGLVEPMISSVFFPTAYPGRNHPDKGLLLSQQEELKRIATVFKAYQEAVPDAKLALTGMADPRGTKPYNQRLSERRVAIVKNFLVAQGITADLITGEAKGEKAPLDRAAVKQLEASNPQQPVAGRNLTDRAKWLAYNRRVDVAIEPAAMESARFYPHQASDAQLLIQPNPATETRIHQASASEAVVAAK
jgi:hypothetical protein